MSKVLVTGGSGFLGSHVISQLMAAGHEVRATLRSASREAEVRAIDAEITFQVNVPRLALRFVGVPAIDEYAVDIEKYLHGRQKLVRDLSAALNVPSSR